MRRDVSDAVFKRRSHARPIWNGPKRAGGAHALLMLPRLGHLQVWFLDVRYGWLQACPTLVCSFNAADGVTDRFPSGSYGHATVNVNNTFYVFGGATADDNVKVWLCG